MRLIVGGKAQGKLSYVMTLGYSCDDIAFCETDEINKIFEKKIIYGLHNLIRRLLERGEDPFTYIINQINDNHIITCDEIGCGIVPLEKFEREYRDTVGSICCHLANKATVVERLCCGIAIKIKG